MNPLRASESFTKSVEVIALNWRAWRDSNLGLRREKGDGFLSGFGMKWRERRDSNPRTLA